MEETKYGYTLTIPRLRQRDVEQFRTAHGALDSPDAITSNGNTVRVAAGLGWIVKVEKIDPDDGVPIGNLTGDAAGELFPFVIEWLSTEIVGAYSASFKPPGE